MFIAFEKQEYNLNELNDVKFTHLYTFWEYIVGEIDSTYFKYFPKRLKPFELDEKIAKAALFAEFNLKYKSYTKLRYGTHMFDHYRHKLNLDGVELVKDEKYVYNIDSEDEKNSVKFMQAVMTNYLDHNFYLLKDKGYDPKLYKKNNILKKILACKTNADCHVILHQHFGFLAIKEHVLDDKLGPCKIDLIHEDFSNIHLLKNIVDPGPTIDNIDSSLFELDWQLIEEVHHQQ